MSERRAFDSDVAESYDFSEVLDLSCAAWLVRVYSGKECDQFVELERSCLSLKSYDFKDDVEMMLF
jgi:hypothetical protein